MTTTIHPREKLIHTAARLVHRQGWTITGINQILNEAGIPKGSFYYYFRSKEALGVAVLQLHHANLKKLLESTLTNPQHSPETALAEFIRELRDGALADVYRFGCPAGNLASETATQCAALLAEAMRGIELYRDAWQNLIDRARQTQPGATDADPRELASIAVQLLQGAMLTYKCTGNFDELELAHAALKQLIFGKAIAASLAASRFSSAERAHPQALAS